MSDYTTATHTREVPLNQAAIQKILLKGEKEIRTRKRIENSMSDLKQAILEILQSEEGIAALTKVANAIKESNKRVKKRGNPDLITTTDAYRLYGRAKVDKLIKGGFLKRIETGEMPNATKYLSKSNLETYKNYYL